MSYSAIAVAGPCRSGHIIDRFTERMNRLELIKSSRKKPSRFAPLASTIGRFTSAFRRFEPPNGCEKTSFDDKSSQSFPPTHSKENSQPWKADTGAKKQQPVVIHGVKSPLNTTRSLPSARSVSLPLESSRLVKPLRETTNTPDVIPTALLPSTTASPTASDSSANTQALCLSHVSRLLWHHFIHPVTA